MTRVRNSRLLNPKETPVVDAADLGWLAGIIDGEGTIALSHGGGTGSPHLRVQITNGSEAILAKIRRILTDCDLKWTEYREARGTTNLSCGTRDALILHQIVRPHMVRQVAQFDAAAAFMVSRYADGRLRVFWTEDERTEWEAMRVVFHPNGLRR